MSRIPGIEPDNASPEVREIYRKYEADGFPVYNAMKMFANKADFVAGLDDISRGLYTDARLAYRELAYRRASQTNALSLLNSYPRDARSEHRTFQR
jgi:hypothetical protein